MSCFGFLAKLVQAERISKSSPPEFALPRRSLILPQTALPNSHSHGIRVNDSLNVAEETPFVFFCYLCFIADCCTRSK